MTTRLTMIMAVIATFAISLNLHSSNEEVVFGAPAVHMPRGGNVYCVYNPNVNDYIWTYNESVCIDTPGECGTGDEVGALGEVSEEDDGSRPPSN